MRSRFWAAAKLGKRCGDTSVFGTQFDFFLAGSIWTHASKKHIEVMLDGFVRDSTATSVFLTSYLPANCAEDDYQGEDWIGTSHESDRPAVIRHSLAWIVAECQKRGLQLQELPGEAFDSQFWLRVHRAGMTPDQRLLIPEPTG